MLQYRNSWAMIRAIGIAGPHAVAARCCVDDAVECEAGEVEVGSGSRLRKSILFGGLAVFSAWRVARIWPSASVDGRRFADMAIGNPTAAAAPRITSARAAVNQRRPLL